MITEQHQQLSIRRQCELLDIHRSGLYYQPACESKLNLELMEQIDRIYMKRPFYGSPRMTFTLQQMGYGVNHKRIERLMRMMDIQAIYPKPRTTNPNTAHKVYPYLLRDLIILGPNHVWCSDITYIPVRGGYLYLVAIMDWYSRYVLSWELSNSLAVTFCLMALEASLTNAIPIIMNTDQGCQFTGKEFTGKLLDNNINISMDGRGRALDNVFIERLWRSLKYEEVYLKGYEDGRHAWEGINNWIEFYNHERPHSSLNNRTPHEIYASKELVGLSTKNGSYPHDNNNNGNISIKK